VHPVTLIVEIAATPSWHKRWREGQVAGGDQPPRQRPPGVVARMAAALRRRLGRARPGRSGTAATAVGEREGSA
jgi:hypothetical protein